jgi:hypothetical protein
MNTQPVRFYPPRRQGLLFHLGAILAFVLIVFLLFALATKTELGLLFLLYLLGALFLAIPIPVLVYRLYALLRSTYELDRNGIRLQWGFRAEDIPMANVLWVKPVEEVDQPIIPPRLRWPGAVLGSHTQEGLGLLEFIASETEELILINTPSKVFAISPQERSHFLQVFQEKIELGSLSPLRPYSAYPRFLPVDIWRLPAARVFLTISLVLSLALFIWVALVIPDISTVSLGFSSSGEPLPPVSAGQLFLLPVVNILLVLAGYAISLYFFRQSEKHPLIYVLSGSSTFTALLFLVAVYFILKTG